ncbi:DUF4405 domain-containing protein [Poritiphilus flavus]|uniref:DUF4405 domain-containing protein n=1 Tax=Poritiphilus flavus TaxID=2697053 RepID=A0A6L9EBS5_9FLAO|nr:DUF4405 domain-containing protein [Poritiphilus flavus]NAS12196.1 hypothetical protein [Poritiphilus flavus]
MMKRKLISTGLALCFAIVSVSGVLSFVLDYKRGIAATHTLFGFLFLIGAFFHISNNWQGLRAYVLKKRSNPYFISLGLILLLLLSLSVTDSRPVSHIMEFGTRLRAGQEREVENNSFIAIDKNRDSLQQLEIELVAGEHYWHPQMAIWLETLDGEYLASLYVTYATAKGTFFGGRTKENFKSFDAKPGNSQEYRRVDALPVWSHKRGVQQADGIYAPSPEDPLVDAISGATLSNSFRLKTSFGGSPEKVRLRLEINVAFDDNEFYSEYDFPEDEVFHNGTGQLGQPSVVYEVVIDLKEDQKKYYLMELVGHGHHSAQTGSVYPDLERLTTARAIVERILVKTFRM